jgi:predicted phosphodiesterase
MLRSSEAIRKKCQRDAINSNSTTDYIDQYESRWNTIKQLGEEYKLIAEECTAGIISEVSRKIITLSDIHFPFAREDDIQQALHDHADADVVVLNGDILDGDVFSTYGGAKRIAALKEYAAAFELVAYCSENFPQVVIVSGNHDRRPAKALARADFQKNASQILRPDLLARIANGERLDQFGEIIELENWDNVIYQAYDSWYVRIGKTVFCHPDAFYGGHPGQTVMKLNNYFSNRLGSDAYDSVVVGHTHRIYKGIIGNKLLIEQGALCARLPYQHKSDLRFTHAMNGYAVIYQDADGNTDFNMSSSVYLGSQLPPKKEIF